MQIFVCDDEPQMVSYITKTVQTYMPQSSVSSFTNGFHLLSALEKENCDLLLLDIDMPEIDGLEIAERLTTFSHKSLLVFVTSHDEMVYDSFLYHPFGFIRKSYLEQELKKLLSDCSLEIASRKKYFNFRAGSEEVRVKLTEIFYFEADGNYLKVFTEKKCFRFRDTLTIVENALSDSGFVRIHKGFLVNQAAVNILGANEVELVGGMRLPIGRHYLESARKKLKGYIMR